MVPTTLPSATGSDCCGSGGGGSWNRTVSMPRPLSAVTGSRIEIELPAAQPYGGSTATNAPDGSSSVVSSRMLGIQPAGTVRSKEHIGRDSSTGAGTFSTAAGGSFGSFSHPDISSGDQPGRNRTPASAFRMVHR
eukprot:618602-Prymnesium_polylepis.1